MCPLCDGTGWQTLERDGVSRVTRCDCWRGDAASRQMVDTRIPRRYLHCDFTNFRDYNESLRRARGRAQKLADAFPVNERGLFLEGPPGVGKTHLAVAVLRQAVARAAPAGSSTTPATCCGSSAAPTTRSSARPRLDILRPVMQADLLVLDDIGAEKTSEWVEETLNLIVNTRYNERRTTIFTSNYEDRPDETDPNTLLCGSGSGCDRGCTRCASSSTSTAPTTGGARQRRRRRPAGAVEAAAPRGGRRMPAVQTDAGQGAAEGPAKLDLKWTGGRAGARERATAGRRMTPLGLYVHVPFCASICHYCNFNRGLLDDELKRRYVEAVVREIAAAPARTAARRAADTMFFGGGTPSLLEPAEIGAIIDACRRAFALAPTAEVTVEANPETRDAGSAGGVPRARRQQAQPRRPVVPRRGTPAPRPRARRRARAAGGRGRARGRVRQRQPRPDDVAARRRRDVRLGRVGRGARRVVARACLAVHARAVPERAAARDDGARRLDAVARRRGGDDVRAGDGAPRGGGLRAVRNLERGEARRDGPGTT